MNNSATPVVAEQTFEQWFESLSPPWPPPGILREHYRHRCQACRQPFFSKRGRDRFCDSCRRIIATRTDELETIAKNAGQRAVLEALECSDCGWVGFNSNRATPQNSPVLLEYLPAWAAKAHCHFMHHVFFNRFRPCRRFALLQRSYARERLEMHPWNWSLDK